jgi:hypothetical protein
LVSRLSGGIQINIDKLEKEKEPEQKILELFEKPRNLIYHFFDLIEKD